MSIIVGVIGNGFVGKATQLFARCPDVTVIIYDIDPDKSSPVGTTLSDLCSQCNVIFICVPTPMIVETGQCDTSIVRSVVRDITQEFGKLSFDSSTAPGIIVRSTVPPGTCDELQVCHMPEYLTERNWDNDFVTTRSWELGIPTRCLFNGGLLASTVQSILTKCVNSQAIMSDKLIVQHTTVTETAKYMRNIMLAVKVSVCNEFAQFCSKVGIKYDDVRSLVASDPRIGPSHMNVPGPDGKNGFGGTCFPKDIKAMIYEMNDEKSDPIVLTAVDLRNETIDRPDKEWMKDIGRAVSSKTIAKPIDVDTEAPPKKTRATRKKK